MLKGPADKGLRVMFLFTDGEDNASHLSPNKAAEIVLTAGVRIYAFAPNPGVELRGDRILAQFTKLTGGPDISAWRQHER